MSSVEEIREAMKKHDSDVGSRAIERFVAELMDMKVNLRSNDNNYYDCVKWTDIKKAMKKAVK